MLLFLCPRGGLRLGGLGCRRGRSRCSNRYRCDVCGSRRGCAMRSAWNHGAWRLRTRGAPRERQQGDIARPLNRHAQPALVARANSRHAARQNFPALLHELRQDVRPLVINEVHLLDAELANFLLPEVLALSTRPPAGAAWPAGASAARSAFASRTAVSTTRPTVTAMAAALTPRCSARRCCLFRIL
jgi:hypothetical protein